MFKPQYEVIPVYFEYGAVGTGMTADDRKPLVDSTNLEIGMPAGFVPITCKVIIETTCTGLTDMLFGVVGTSNHYVATGNVSAATAATYSGAGTGLAARTAAAINFAVDFTGTISAGKMIVVVEGYKV